jgi:hypothetical protein
MLAVTGNEKLADVAKQVGAKLQRVINAVSS